MIYFENVGLSYGESSVLEDLTLYVSPGEHIALMGPSGCGKSSLLNIAAGLLPPGTGRVRINTRRIAYVFQEPRLLPWLTAAQNVNAVLSDKPATMPQAMQWLEAVGLADAADKLPRELSGGMQQRVNLARALAFNGELLLLDEPSHGLDEDLQESIWSLLKRHTQGKTLLLVTHDRQEATQLADRVLTYQNKTFE